MANYEVDILVNGRPIRQFRHNHQTFIEGRKGSTFELRIRNNTYNKVDVVPSVDGLSVINGEPSGLDSEGYLVESRSSVIIPGWRLNNDSVAKFLFNDKNRSYSNQIGEGTDNVGVLGFMVFQEKLQPVLNWPDYYNQPAHPLNPHPWYYGNGSNGTGEWLNSGVTSKGMRGSSVNVSTSFESLGQNSLSASSASLDSNEAESAFSIGTGWGEEMSHAVTMVDFERRNPQNPDFLLSIYYDDRKGLEKRGIRVTRASKTRTKKLPEAFPIYNESGCKPPHNWRGRR